MFLLLSAAFTCHAQETAEALIISKNGNIIAQRDCTVEEIALFLNTTNQIVEQALPDDTIVVLRQGDSIQADYGRELVPDKVTGLGKIISWCLGDNISKYFFSHYWHGNGNIDLSCNQFIGILACIKQNNLGYQLSADTLAHDGLVSPITISFYNTMYEKTFGYATIYVNTDNRIVGFHDIYDYNPLEWGVRPCKYEFLVRLVAIISPSTSSTYEINYGISSKIPVDAPAGFLGRGR